MEVGTDEGNALPK